MQAWVLPVNSKYITSPQPHVKSMMTSESGINYDPKGLNMYMAMI